ncbi:hypothetical protein ACJX0J_007082, partial [Zea mays]
MQTKYADRIIIKSSRVWVHLELTAAGTQRLFVGIGGIQGTDTLGFTVACADAILCLEFSNNHTPSRRLLGVGELGETGGVESSENWGIEDFAVTFSEDSVLLRYLHLVLHPFFSLDIAHALFTVFT